MSYPTRLVPWRTPSDLKHLKSLFFPVTESPAPRVIAVQRVRAWSTRMRIPHSIESTALLVSAMLSDTPTSSQLSVRLCYATAICRFVNGLLDPAQQSAFAQPMHNLARSIGLPTSFVEIRHAATHEALPSLALLRNAAGRAVQWLWENYWTDVGADGDGTEDQGDLARARTRELLKSWCHLRRGDPVRALKSGDGREDTRQALAVIREVVGLAGKEEGLEALIDGLLEEKALIPAGNDKTPLMPGAILLWTPLLEKIDEAQPGFGNTLLIGMLEVFRVASGSSISGLLAASVLSSSPPATATVTTEPEFAEAVLRWMTYLTGSENKSKFGKNPNIPLDLDGVAKQCVLYPSEWTIRLLKHLLKEHEPLRERYSGLVEMAESQVELSQGTTAGPEGKKPEAESSKAAGKKRSIHDVEEELELFEARYESTKTHLMRKSGPPTPTPAPEGAEVVGDKELVIGRWRKPGGKWEPRPIGVL